MAKMQIVFLFDLNAFNEEPSDPTKDIQRRLLSLRVACLRILTHYSTTVSNLKWGFKFFDSKGSLTQSMQNFSFPNVSLESFEILENEICTKYQRHISYLEALAKQNHNTTILNEEENYDYNQTKKVVHPVQILHLALTQILYEYQWNDCLDMFSPSTKKRTHSNLEKKNLLFFISQCASNDDQFQTYFGVECASLTVSKFTNVLLSSSLNKQLLDKASILWIWLNTSEHSFLGNSKPSSTMIVANTLKSLKCSLLPLSVLSKLNYILKLKTIHGDQGKELASDVSCSSLVPFSSTFSQSLSYPFYLERQALTVEAEIHVQDHQMKFPVLVTQVPLLWNKKIGHLYHELNIDKKETKSPQFQVDTNQNIPIIWKTFTAQFVVARHILLKTDKMLLLLPRISDNMSSYLNIGDLIKSLVLKNVNLFMICESVCGSTVPAVLNPLSESSAILAILDPKVSFPNMAVFQNSIGKTSENFVLSDIKNIIIAETCNNLTHENNGVKQLENSCDSEHSNLKSFQMECVESWFEPTSAVSPALQEILKDQKSAPVMEKFHDKLHRFYKNGKNQKTGTSEVIKKEVTEPTVCSDQTEKLEEIEELYKDVTYEELISILNQTYDVALRNSDVLHSAKKIIKLASNFFLKKSIISYEESMKNFMQEYFCLTCRKVIEKYKSNDDEDASSKKVNECQLQAILALEMEVLFPSPEVSICADNVRSFLGVLSFNSTPAEHNKFLTEVLKENYIHKLYDILLEIGDELIMPDEDSVDSGNEDHLMSDPLGSVASSALSVKSNSSTSSRGETRKLIKKRSNISDTNKSRQVLLPAKSPKRKKLKSSFVSENNPIRYSPRLASKKKRSKYKTVDSKPETARRNLFPKGQKPHTPRTSSVRTPKKKKAQTPKNHHVLKTNFVPETPSHKQNQSALQRRKSQMEITSPKLEVAESPQLKTENSKRSSILDRLKKLKENKISSNTKPEIPGPSSSSSFQPHRTPESKRRLSLKLFSKETFLLTSPTARMGLKKCSKRLFDQISPRVFAMPAKKIKLEDNIQNGNVGESSNEPHTPKKWHPLR